MPTNEMRQVLVTHDVLERGARKSVASATSSVFTELETVKDLRKSYKETTASEFAAAGVAFGAVCSALAAVAIEQTVVVILAGTLSTILSLYAFWQQTRVMDIKIKALHKTNFSIRTKVEELLTENRILAKNMDELRTSVQYLEDVQQVLAAIATTQVYSMNSLRELAEDNKKFLKQMKSSVKATVLQHLLHLIFRADADGDLDEASDLVHRIQNTPGVNPNDVQLRFAISSKSLDFVLELIADLMSANTDFPGD
jgi:hypothetical protein